MGGKMSAEEVEHLFITVYFIISIICICYFLALFIFSAIKNVCLNQSAETLETYNANHIIKVIKHSFDNFHSS